MVGLKGKAAEALLLTTNKTVAEIAKSTGLKERQVYNVKRKNLVAESQGLHDLAFKGLKKFLKAETFGEIERITAGDVLRAQEMTFARTEPILKEEPTHTGVVLNISFSKREAKPGMEIDITPKSGGELANKEANNSDL